MHQERAPCALPRILFCSYNQQQVMDNQALANFNSGIQGIRALVRLSVRVVAAWLTDADAFA